MATAGLFVGELDAEAQFITGKIDFSHDPLVYASCIMLSGLAIAPLTLDIVQGVQLARRAHTSLGVTVPNLVFSTLELTFGALIIGDFTQSPIPDGPWVAVGAAAMVHAASSIAWSIYGITRTRPPTGTASRALTDKTIILPAPRLLRTPSGTAPGLSLGGSF